MTLGPLARTAIVVAAVLSAAATTSAQVAPFSVGGDRPPAPAAPAPSVAAGGTPASPAPFSPGAPVPTGGGLRQQTPLPAPFDINGDGVTPAVEEPDQQPRYLSASTTISPLATGRGPAPVLPVDATNPEEWQNLRNLLRDEERVVRELRVAVANQTEWVEPLVDRPILPSPVLRLDGEIDSTTFSFFVSPAESAQGGALSLAFDNSVLVLPEASRLRVLLNGRQIAQTAIDSPERIKVIVLPISSDLLRPGKNTVRIEAEMRHRIDCSLDATYELWARLEPRLTGLSFANGRVPLASMADLPAVGVGANGATRLRILQHMPQSTASVDRMLRAVQSASLFGRYRQPLVEIASLQQQPGAAVGMLNIAIGTADELRPTLPTLPSAASTGPTVTVVDDPSTGPTLFITGPDEGSVDRALDRFAASERAATAALNAGALPQADQSAGVEMDGPGTMSLREAGIETINFSGRRFLTRFHVTLPPDFYASAYGEARLYLDAAYSGDVDPGSQLTVLVNGRLGTTIAFSAKNGEVFDDLPIALTLTSFRPGLNTISIQADLDTEADRACLPGGTVQSRDRFALFSTTRLVFPAFARVAQIPNLASFASDGFPYSLSNAPVSVAVNSNAFDTVGAAGTLLSRIAVSRGNSLATRAVQDLASVGNTGAIIVAPIQELPSFALDATGATGFVPASWLQPYSLDSGTNEPEGLERYDAILQRLRQQLNSEDPIRGGADRGDGRSTLLDPAASRSLPETDADGERWLPNPQSGRDFGASVLDTIRSLRGTFINRLGMESHGAAGQAAAAPIPESTTLLLVQAPAPTNPKTAWTLVTAPTPSLLSTAMASISAPDEWDRIGGRLAAFDVETHTVETLPAGRVSYLATVPWSFQNLRLIAANWLSLNDTIYVLALVATAVVLGLLTYALVSFMGRKPK